MARGAQEFATLSIESVDEHVTIVKLSRPDASNALNTQMGKDLVRCFEDIALDPRNLLPGLKCRSTESRRPVSSCCV